MSTDGRKRLPSRVCPPVDPRELFRDRALLEAMALVSGRARVFNEVIWSSDGDPHKIMAEYTRRCRRLGLLKPQPFPWTTLLVLLKRSGMIAVLSFLAALMLAAEGIFLATLAGILVSLVGLGSSVGFTILRVKCGGWRQARRDAGPVW
jgi:hypothetical protein